MGTRKHYFIPDLQIRPGDVVDHVDWIAMDIVRRKPDVIVVAGDWWDLPSMSSYSPPGGMEKENSRLVNDIECGRDAMHRLSVPIHKEVKRLIESHKPRWNPDLWFLEGNHEHRIARVAINDARFEGVVGTHLLDVETFGFRRVPFEVPVCIDGIWYCHYWKSPHSPRPIGGTIENRLNKLGFSFVQGHEQGKRYGDRQLPNGKTIHGLVLGSCYLPMMDYRGPQGANEWRGVAVLQDVHDGDYEPMFLTLRYLCREYADMELVDYLNLRYPERDWRHLARE